MPLCELPIDLVLLANFCLADPTAQALIHSTTNSFFAPVKGPGGAWRIGVREEEGQCWGALPHEWRSYLLSCSRLDRASLLKALADGTIKEGYPSSLKDFLHQTHSLALNRTRSDIPLLSHPLSQRDPTTARVGAPVPPPSQSLSLEFKKRPQNELGVGLSPKKQHEVETFCRLVQSIRAEDSSASSFVVDVGSGRAHLSRQLAAPPLGLHVLALDWSASQLAGAERLDEKKSVPASSEASESDKEITGSLTHRISSLDADGIEDVLKTWSPEGGAMLVALHACGDLTVDSLKAFTRNSDGDSSDFLKRKMVAVGCCYNLMTPELFPLSEHLATLPTPPLVLTRDHLLLTAQTPQTWHLSPASTSSLASSITKLAHRSRLGAELEAHGLAEQPKLGRIGVSINYLDYRRKALQKASLLEQDLPTLRFGISDEEEDGEREWEDGLFQLEAYWTLRARIGPPLESFLLLDRFAFLVERLERAGVGEGEDSRRVELVNLFDQASGSLRNVALVVR